MRGKIKLALAGAAVAGLALAGLAGSPAMASGSPAPITGSVTVLASISMSADQTSFQYGGASYVAIAGAPSAFKMSGGQATPDFSVTVTSGDPAGYAVLESTADFSGSSQVFPASAATAFFVTTAPMPAPGPVSGGIAGSNSPVVALNHSGPSGASGDLYYSYNQVTPPASLASTSLLSMSTTLALTAIAN